jgi:hypothetical protein
MNDRALLSARVADCNARSPICSPVSDECKLSRCPENATPDDRYALRLSDESREDAIRRAGAALIAAYSRKEAARRRYEVSSCLTDRADMDAASLDARQALRVMEALIRGRSAQMVARMEQERGL